MNLEKSLDHLDPNLRITVYDEEIYKFDNMLDEYTKKLSASALNLGYVSVDPKSYVWKTEKIIESVKKYYKEFFDIDTIDVTDKNMSTLLQNYLDGLTWTFEFYYNQFDIQENREKADTWFYPYTHAPLLTQLYHYLKIMVKKDNQYFDTVAKRLEKYKVKRDIYFNCLEHLMYVSPVMLDTFKSIVPEEYMDFVENSGYYYDLNKVVNDIWNNRTSDYINCKGALFLNKCHVEIPGFMQTFEQDKKFISDLRKIDLKETTKKRACYYKKGQNYNYATMKGGSKKSLDKSLYWHNYQKAKEKYLETGDNLYKRIYKEHKYMYNLL